jgi:hypothetical protein
VGSNPIKIIGFSNLLNPFGRTMALEFTLLTKMGIRNRKNYLCGIERGRHVRLATSTPSVSCLSRPVFPNLFYAAATPAAIINSPRPPGYPKLKFVHGLHITKNK